MNDRPYWPHSNPAPSPAAGTTEPDPDKPPPCQCLTCRDDCSHSCRDRVCRSCRRRMDDQLADLPDQHRRLGELLEPGAAASQRVSGSRTPPLPVRLAALNLLGNRRGSTDSVHEDTDPKTGKPYGDQHGGPSIVDMLFGWERDWRERRGLSAGSTFLGTPAQAAETLVKFLRTHLDPWACDHHPAIDEFAADLRQLRHEIRSVLDDWDGDRQLTDVECPDPDCDMRTLILRAGSNYVECTTCGRLWNEAELVHLGLVLSEGAA